MRLLSSSGLRTTVAATLLAGCSASVSSATVPVPIAGGAQSRAGHFNFTPVWRRLASVIPDELRLPQPMLLHGRAAPAAAVKGIYANEYYATDILGYRAENRDGPPICAISGVSYLNGIAVDQSGYLIDPDGGTGTVIIFKGPKMCGPEYSFALDPYGQPSDAASLVAQSGPIAVANIFDSNGAGSISVCSFVTGCNVNLTNQNMYEVAGVAMDKRGDCWASAVNSLGTATLTYFTLCSGRGQAATGFVNSYFGGLDIDKKGNLVSISAFDGQLYVYKGCNPGCSLVGGPFPLQGEAVFGHLNKKGNEFATGDYQYGQIDIYKYRPSALTYEYSFNNGLSTSLIVEDAVYNPRSKE